MKVGSRVTRVCGYQVALLVADSKLVKYSKSLELLMCTAKLDTIPINRDARDQLAFFANSLLMNIPTPPSVGAMRSWSVLTPFYSEDVNLNVGVIGVLRGGS